MLPAINLALLGVLPIAAGLPAVDLGSRYSLEEASTRQGKLTPAQMRADIEQLARAVREEWSYFTDRSANNGLDLSALVAGARAAVEEPLDRAAFGAEVRKLVASLNDGHGNVRFDTDALPSHYVLVDAVETTEGIVLAEVGDGMTVEPGARAPKVGDLLVAIDGTPVERLISDLVAVTCGSTLAQRRALAIRDLRIAHGPELDLEAEDADGIRHTVALKTRAFPLMPTRDNWGLSWPRPEVALLRIESFAVADWAAWIEAAPEDREPFLRDTYSRIADIFTELHEREATALLIDLRGNGGGPDLLGQRVAMHLLDKPFQYYLLSAKRNGAWSEPYGETHESLAADPPFSGRVIALTDELCFSATDNLLRCLRDLHPRFTTIGGPTGAGTGAPREIVRLDHSGARITLCTMRVLGPKGGLIEGRGTTPDVVVRPSRDDVRSGRDAVLSAALAAALGE